MTTLSAPLPGPKADIVIFTVNEHETAAITAAFKRKNPASPIGNRSYYDLGVVGGARVFHAITQMGDQATSAAARAAITALSPKLLMCVGVAWGAKPFKWQIGDVLLATRLHDWAHRKESADDGVIPRGFTIPPSDNLLQLARTAFLDWTPDPDTMKPNLRDGLLLSNPVLYDDEVERQKALDAHPEAVGGEMEGRGLVWEASHGKTDWLIIKSVCDWGAGKNAPGVDKTASQRIAAKNSAEFVRYLIQSSIGPVLGSHPEHAQLEAASPKADSDSGSSAISDLKTSFRNSRLDQNGSARRRSLRLLLLQLRSQPSQGFNVTELEARIWRELTRDARTLQERHDAWSTALDSVERLLLCPGLSREQEATAYNLLAEWSIDFSQAHIPGVPINKTLHQLNQARTSISKRLGPVHAKAAVDRETGDLLCLRSKCDRAIASLLKRRGQSNPKVRSQIENHKNLSLHDARQGVALHPSELNLLELALSLFAQSASPRADSANEAMDVLESSVQSGAGPLTRYELVRQHRFRYQFAQAVQVFEQIRDQDRNRYLRNATHLAYAAIGLHYEHQTDLSRSAALLAMPLLDELIVTDRHGARDVVDLCYLRAICGWGIDDFTAPLATLKPTSSTTWTEIGNLASKAAKGDLADALLLGLEDPVIWSRIASFYLEFAKDPRTAIEFYDRAIIIAPLSPVFHFNKAEALAYGLGDFQSAKASFEYALSLKKNSYAWFKSITNKLSKLEEAIAQGCSPQN